MCLLKFNTINLFNNVLIVWHHANMLCCLCVLINFIILYIIYIYINNNYILLITVAGGEIGLTTACMYPYVFSTSQFK